MRAREFAYDAHSGQLYGDGSPYSDHLDRVASRFVIGSVEWSVAYLHDVIEDTDYDEVFLHKEFGYEITSRVAILSKNNNTNIRLYYARILDNRIAKLVKLADLQDNLAHCIINLRTRPNERNWMSMAERYAKYTHYLMSGEWQLDTSKEVEE